MVMVLPIPDLTNKTIFIYYLIVNDFIHQKEKTVKVQAEFTQAFRALICTQLGKKQHKKE